MRKYLKEWIIYRYYRIEHSVIMEKSAYWSLSLIICLTFGCTNQEETTQARPPTTMEDRIIYSASDSSDFLFVAKQGDSVKVKSFALARDFTMKRVPSASGVKYQGEDDFFFWLKGEEFLWGQGDSIWTTGFEAASAKEQPNKPLPFDFKHYGHYVSDGYTERNQGYDWMAVTIKESTSQRVAVSIRSRADKKKPTCTYDALAVIVDENTLSIFNEFSIELKFAKDTLTIQGKTEADNNHMFYYCSGGATIGGKYHRIDGPLDMSQIDNTGYFNSLGWKEVFFQVEVTESQLQITPRGLEIDNRPVVHELEGQVTQSEIGDLNLDGFPEVLVYVTAPGSGSYGSVIGYSVNNGKSMSQIYLPPISNNPELSSGYMGHDEFAIVESTLVRRFPIYLKGDTNAAPSGGTRQIQYKLVDGEASRRFEVDKTIEY